MRIAADNTPSEIRVSTARNLLLTTLMNNSTPVSSTLAQVSTFWLPVLEFPWRPEVTKDFSDKLGVVVAVRNDGKELDWGWNNHIITFYEHEETMYEYEYRTVDNRKLTLAWSTATNKPRTAIDQLIVEAQNSSPFSTGLNKYSSSSSSSSTASGISASP